MLKLEYSQIVRKKLKKLRNELTQNYGEHNSKKIMGKITKRIRLLETSLNPAKKFLHNMILNAITIIFLQNTIISFTV